MNLPDPLLPTHTRRTTSDGSDLALLPCPFCSATSELVLHWYPALDDGEETLAAAWVECEFCGCNGPGCEDELTAVMTWNDRYTAFTPHWN
ncbi:MAG: Lar family restriction alleviation protein [Bacteroidota bacterium]